MSTKRVIPIDDPIPLPGMESVLEDPELNEEESDARFFDAARLPDAPGYQPVAYGAITYTIMILCPSHEILDLCLDALTQGKRKRLADHQTVASLDSVRKPSAGGENLVEMWRRVLLNDTKTIVYQTREDANNGTPQSV